VIKKQESFLSNISVPSKQINPTFTKIPNKDEADPFSDFPNDKGQTMHLSISKGDCKVKVNS
jgi:hypothetical protein